MIKFLSPQCTQESPSMMQYRQPTTSVGVCSFSSIMLSLKRYHLGLNVEVLVGWDSLTCLVLLIHWVTCLVLLYPEWIYSSGFVWTFQTSTCARYPLLHRYRHEQGPISFVPALQQLKVPSYHLLSCQIKQAQLYQSPLTCCVPPDP